MAEKKSTLYIIQGFIGAGKSTFSKKLSFETGAQHLNPDESVSKFFEKSFYMENWDYCFDETTNRLWEKTRELLLNSKDVIFDMGFWHKRDRDKARKVAEECGASVKHYYLFVPDEILKQRIVATRPREWAEIHLKNFEKNKLLFEEPEESEEAVVIHNY